MLFSCLYCFKSIHSITFLRNLLFFKFHSSCWYSKNKNYSSLIKEDICIRDFLNKNISNVFISLIEIKRRSNNLFIYIHVLKPVTVIGKSGSKLLKLRNNLSSFLSLNFTSRNIAINVMELTNPDLNSRFLSDLIRKQLEKRVPFKLVMKAAILKAKKAGAKGVKIQISGRLNGAEIARTEWIREGRVPLHTLKANIDYYNNTARVIFFLVF